MKSKERLGPLFGKPARRTTATASSGVDFSGVAKTTAATFTDLFNFFEDSPVTMPEITLTNPDSWSPLILHFSWHTPEGEVDVALRDRVGSFIDTMARFTERVDGSALPGLPQITCDATTHNEGRLVFPRPEDAYSLLVKIVDRHPKIKDPHTALFAARGPMYTAPTAQLDHVLARPYMSETAAFADAASAQTLADHPSIYLIALGRIRNEICLARGIPLANPLLALH